jgi:hypothetical protein
VTTDLNTLLTALYVRIYEYLAARVRVGRRPRLTGVPVEQVSAGFHHVAAGVTLRPVDLLDEAGLLALVSGTAQEEDEQ